MTVVIHVSGALGEERAKESADPGLGIPFSAWYLSLKTSKGYCGLLPATAAAGGYGFVIACNNKAVQYGSQFTLLLPPRAGEAGGDASEQEDRLLGEGHGGDAPAAAARALLSGLTSLDQGRGRIGITGRGTSVGRATLPEPEGTGPAAKGDERRGQRPVVLHRHPSQQRQQRGPAGAEDDGDGGDGYGGELLQPSDAAVITSGRTLRLLSRGAGLCNSPPPLPPAATATAPAPAVQPQVQGQGQVQGHGQFVEEAVEGGAGGEGGGDDAGGGGVAGRLWGAAAALLRRAVHTVGCWLAAALSHPSPSCAWPGRPSPTARATSGGGGPAGDQQRRRGDGGGVADAPPRPLVCTLAQPSALTFRVFKPDLKDGVEVDLSKEWVYLMEGDKFCTLADVAGLSAVVSCHLDSPGWSGYKFQLQPLSRPRAQLVSLLTGGPCGVRLPDLPGPHDVECGPGQQAGRAPELDLMLQTPGSALAEGVVVGLSTFSAGLTGSERQRCCAQVPSPHILLCEPPGPGAVPNECWFQLRNVKISSRASLAEATEPTEAAAPLSLPGGGGGAMVGSDHATGWLAFWLGFLRRLASEMSPAGSDPDLDPEPFPGADPALASGAPAWALAPGSLGPRPQQGQGGLASAAAQRGGGGAGAWGGEWDPDSRPDPQPYFGGMLGGTPFGDGSKARGLTGKGLRRRGFTAAAAGVDEGGGEGRSLAARRRQESADEETEGETAARAASWSGGGAGQGGGGGGGGIIAALRLGVRGAAPLGDGSLVMLTSRAFGRYCSASLDGTLLCVSAQGSNASRNLFTLVLPQLQPASPVFPGSSVQRAWAEAGADAGGRVRQRRRRRGQ